MAATGPPTAPAGAVPQPSFAVRDAAPLERAAVPTLRFALEIAVDGAVPVRSMLLDVQIQIAGRRRGYDAAEQERLYELFGYPRDWGTTLRTLLWTRTTLVVPPFVGETVIDLPVACTYDLDVTATRYFDALAGGDVPLELLFSGSVFYGGADGRLQTARIPWDREAECRLPVAVWRATIDRHFPGTGWLRLGRETLGELAAYRSAQGHPTWDAALAALLAAGREG